MLSPLLRPLSLWQAERPEKDGPCWQLKLWQTGPLVAGLMPPRIPVTISLRQASQEDRCSPHSCQLLSSSLCQCHGADASAYIPVTISLRQASQEDRCPPHSCHLLSSSLCQCPGVDASALFLFGPRKKWKYIILYIYQTKRQTTTTFLGVNGHFQRFKNMIKVWCLMYKTSIFKYVRVKGTVSRESWRKVFSWIIFLWSPDYPNRAFFLFFPENSRKTV